MLEFSILYAILILILLISQLSVNKKFYFISSILILTILAAFRGPNIGNDTHEYIRLFEQINSGVSENTRYEVGYIWLNRILYTISNNYQIIFILTSILIYYSFGRFIWKYSYSPILSVIILFSYGFYSFTFSAIRQGLAIAILLFAFDFIISGKILKFLLLICLASLFHSSAIFFIFAYLARYLKPSLKTFIIFVLIGFAGVVVFSSILNFMFGYFSMYEHYESSSYVGDAGIGNILFIVISSLILLFSYSILNNNRTKTKLSQRQITENNYLMIMVLFAVVIYILSMKANILDRIALYYNVFSIVLLPNALKMLKLSTKYLVYPMIILAFFAYSFAILIFRPNWNSIFPYSFCW